MEQEIESLRHDIERHIAIASEHATECERLRAELAEAKRQSVRIYNSGYHAGHHDTVEGQYTHILPCDMDTYHGDIVAALAAEE